MPRKFVTMKNSRNLAISILLAITLLAAPSAMARPFSLDFDGDIVELVRNAISDFTSIFSPASGFPDPSGAQNDDNDSTDQDQEEGEEEESGGTDGATPNNTQDNSTAYPDPAG